MRSKRHEAFRYISLEKMPAFFTITQINGSAVTTSKGAAILIDISSEGMRIQSALHIPHADEKEVHLHFSFQLNDIDFNYGGELIWKRERYPNYEYGMHLFTDESGKTELIKQLKKYTKENSTRKDKQKKT